MVTAQHDEDVLIVPGVSVSMQQPDGTYMVLLWELDEAGNRKELVAVSDVGLTKEIAERRVHEVVAELEMMAVEVA